MQDTKTKFILIVLVGVLVISLTYFGFKSSTESNSIQSSAVNKAVDIKTLVEEEQSKLPADLQSRLKQYGKNKTDLQQLIVLWDSLGKSLPSAYYMFQLAEVDQNENNWLLAGSKYYNAAMMSNDTNVYMEAGNFAKTSFEKALAMNPNNLTAKNSLAACYVDIDRDIMKGVGMLREVVAVDSNNVQAIFTLGMLSIQSGQLDKAKQRFLKLIAIEPFNAESYYYLGEVYAKLGETEEAIQTYEKCKTLLKDKESKKEVEALINKLKTI